jgi:threonine dehydratase
MRVIRHGMASAGRYLYLRVCIPDRPGGLARLLTELGQTGANILEVVHERISPSLLLDEVEVSLQMETRGEPHAEKVITRLRECGYRIYE